MVIRLATVKKGVNHYPFIDCPNGFIFIKNKCYRWMAGAAIDSHLITGHLFRGNLFEISPLDAASEAIAQNLATLYSSTSVYAGTFWRPSFVFEM